MNKKEYLTNEHLRILFPDHFALVLVAIDLAKHQIQMKREVRLTKLFESLEQMAPKRPS